MSDFKYEDVTLPEYKCHKVVKAAKIRGVSAFLNDEKQFGITLDVPECHIVTQAWIERFKPTAGDYLVVYPDGYVSVSPAKAFEEGYTRI